MRVSDIILEQEPKTASKLVQVLRTVINSADQAGQSVYLHFSKPTKEDVRQGSKNLDLNKLMQNVGGEQFDYGTFKAAYDTDARIKTMVTNFSKQVCDIYFIYFKPIYPNKFVSNNIVITISFCIPKSILAK